MQHISYLDNYWDLKGGLWTSLQNLFFRGLDYPYTLRHRGNKLDFLFCKNAIS